MYSDLKNSKFIKYLVFRINFYNSLGEELDNIINVCILCPAISLLET